MKRCVRHALIFTGGVTTGLAVGAVGVAAFMVKHKEYVAEGIRKAIKDWIRKDMSTITVGIHDNEFVFNTRLEAEVAIEGLEECMHKYGFVTMADFKSMLELDSTYVDDLKGWHAGAKFTIQRNKRGGYRVIPMAPPQDIRKEVKTDVE